MAPRICLTVDQLLLIQSHATESCPYVLHVTVFSYSKIPGSPSVPLSVTVKKKQLEGDQKLGRGCGLRGQEASRGGSSSHPQAAPMSCVLD